MKIVIYEKALEYEKALLNKNEHFLQSVSWAEFNISMGKDVLLFLYKNINGDLCASFGIIRIQGKILRTLYIPYVSSIFLECCKYLERDKLQLLLKPFLIHRIMVEPYMLDCRGVFDKTTFTLVSNEHIQPHSTLIIDVSQGIEDLLAQMHSKTRYNIRLSEKKGVRCIVDTRGEYVDVFLHIMGKTAQRNHFGIHGEEYYRRLLKLPCTKLIVAQHKGKVIAGVVLYEYNNRVTYLHGASDYEYRNIMAPYALQWFSIVYAREQGFHEYDMWGVGNPVDASDPWSGFTRFKVGFAPHTSFVKYCGLYHSVYNTYRYGLYRYVKYIITFFGIK